MIETTAEIRVRYAETDQMGVAYHGHFFVWFEVARTQLLTEQGLPYRELEAQGFRLPVLEAAARFLLPARYDDLLHLRARLTERPLLRITIDYEVRRGLDLLATGRTVHAFITPYGRPVRPPPAFVAAMDRAFGR